MEGDESEESEMSDSGEDEKLTEEEREKKRHRDGVLEDGWFFEIVIYVDAVENLYIVNLATLGPEQNSDNYWIGDKHKQTDFCHKVLVTVFVFYCNLSKVKGYQYRIHGL